MSIETNYVQACAAKLRQSTERIAVCVGKLSEDQVWSRGNENENSVGNLVLHLIGNVRQRAMHALGGQPDVRDRDREFSASGGMAPAELIRQLRETMDDAAGIIDGLTVDQLTKTYEVQATRQTGVEMLLQVVEHFGQHTGQIIYATKHLTGEDLGLAMPRKSK